MGRISETPFWVEQLYRIQVSDPILGGEDGVTNIQPSQLANRTRYLREILTREHDESGAHCIVGNMLVDVPVWRKRSFRLRSEHWTYSGRYRTVTMKSRS